MIVLIIPLLYIVQSQTTTNTTTATTTTTTISYANQGSDWSQGVCSSSSSQSPINLEVSSGTCDNSMVLDIQFKKEAMQIVMERVQHTIQSNATISNLYATDINGNLYGYTATQFMFHGPSEHTIEGTRYDLEMQIVHELKSEFSATITKAIVSILFEVSSTDQPFFTTYDFALMAAPTTSNTTSNTTANQTNSTNTTTAKPVTSTIASINFNDLLGSQLDANPAYYTYIGSLTIPDCDDNVNWYILDSVLPITQTQLDAFNTFFLSNTTFASGNGNNRAIQSTNDRVIKKGGVACEEQFVYFFSFFILYIFINYFIFKLL
ncbi:unnamed protein product [Paramecium sonneborni]|uniref:Alpha-carbonic anhydrase domain-containing protein n=1 Tax=Paramecium sonneborni TaxID=65129 RepID=A0A8S1JZG5_9CILI|nr:unnamed protein product [Paramecium sonneborni]